jgi:hypothetical protein
MKLNVFEGARRILMAFSGIWVVGWVTFAIVRAPEEPPYLSYSIAGPGQPMIRTAGCEAYAEIRNTSALTPKGYKIGVHLCFKTQMHRTNLWEEREFLIPYVAASSGTATSPSAVALGRLEEDDVKAYLAAVIKGFVLPADGIKEADQLSLDTRLDPWKQAIASIGLGLVVVWTSAILIGWVIRGFMGIPRGKDARPIL